jgi:hypothetical protein
MLSIPARPRRFCGTLLGMALGLAMALPCGAGADPPDPPPEAEKKLVIHGYLSQAFAVSDGYQVLGIPSDGTFDYRTAALQFRASVSSRDSFVIQFSQVRLGESPVMEVRNEIDLDWIFYERLLAAGTSLRVGRVRAPYGIYNETRFVGPLLPFFRAPEAFYGEASFAFDRLDGIVLSRSLFAARRFSLDADLYAGEWRFLQADKATWARAKKGLGGQLWLNTPLRGLRVGIAGNRSNWSNSLQALPGAKPAHERWAASVDGRFERFRLSAEFQRDSFPGGAFESSYALVSLHVTDELSLNLQAAQARARIALARFDEQVLRDRAAGLSYAFRPGLVVKVEGHWIKGRNFDEPGVTVFSPPLEAKYLIVSLSTLF